MMISDYYYELRKLEARKNQTAEVLARIEKIKIEIDRIREEERSAFESAPWK